MEGGNPRLANVTNRLATLATSAAKERGVILVPEGQDALGELVSRAALALGDEGLLDDDRAVDRAEQALVTLVDQLPTPGLERRAAGGPPPQRVGEQDIMAAFAGLCPGLWPLC